MFVVMLDMDGVLTDFEGAVCDLFGHEHLGPEHLGKTLAEHIGISTRTMWARIDEEGAGFWEHLAPTPFADDLVRLARDAGRLFIASSPSSSPGSLAGKLRWLHRRLGRNFRDFAITPKKDLLAAPGRLLVDDSSRHVDAFREAGGAAVLFPTIVNGGATPGVDPLDVVRRGLEEAGIAIGDATT